jgi:proliferating cell nuclear antigen
VNLAKILKCAGNDDSVTMKADDDGDVVNFLFEGEDRTSDFEMKLMDIDSEHLSIPETEYKCVVQMPSGEFQRIVRDLSVLGDTCTISVTKEGVKFTVSGDLGTGNMMRKQNTSSEKKEERTSIDMEEPVELTFALQYLTSFTKATPLSDSVTLHMSKEVPLMVEYKVEAFGHLRFYLAPKIDVRFVAAPRAPSRPRPAARPPAPHTTVNARAQPQPPPSRRRPSKVRGRAFFFSEQMFFL